MTERLICPGIAEIPVLLLERLEDERPRDEPERLERPLRLEPVLELERGLRLDERLVLEEFFDDEFAIRLP